MITRSQAITIAIQAQPTRRRSSYQPFRTVKKLIHYDKLKSGGLSGAVAVRATMRRAKSHSIRR